MARALLGCLTRGALHTGSREPRHEVTRFTCYAKLAGPSSSISSSLMHAGTVPYEYTYTVRVHLESIHLVVHL